MTRVCACVCMSEREREKVNSIYCDQGLSFNKKLHFPKCVDVCVCMCVGVCVRVCVFVPGQLPGELSRCESVSVR